MNRTNAGLRFLRPVRHLAALALCALLPCVLRPVSAAGLYWSANGTTPGGAGTWDTSASQWGAAPAGPFPSVWTNANNDTASFGGTAGPVTNNVGITVGGLQFNTTGYVISNGASALTFGAANNTITLNNVAAATIVGSVGGSGNDVTLTAGQPATAGTLTFSGVSSGGWSGTTTVGPQTRLELTGNANNQALLDTTNIILNGGTVAIGNGTTGVGGSQATLNRINDSAPITSYGGAIAYDVNNGSSNSEAVGTANLVRGQMSLTEAYSLSSGSSTFIFSGLTRTGAVNTSVLNLTAKNTAFSTGPTTPFMRVVVGGIAANTPPGEIVGPWLTTLYSNLAAADYVRYTNGGSGSTYYAVPAGVTLTAPGESGWGSTSVAYIRASEASPSATTLTGSRTAAALRNTATATNVTVTSGNPTIPVAGHAFNDGDPVVIGGTAPGGFTAGQIYFVVNSVAGVSIQLSATVGGAAITPSSAGTSVNVTGGIRLDGNTLGTYGLLNGSAAPLMISASGGSGYLTLPASGTGTLYVTPGVSAVNINAPIQEFDGSSPLTLVKSGSGTLTLSSNNTHTGGTVLNAGTLFIQTQAALGASQSDRNLTVNGTATLEAPNSVTYSLGTLTLNGGGVLTVANSTGKHFVFSSLSGSNTASVIHFGNGLGSLTLNDASGYTGNLLARGGSSSDAHITFSQLSDAAGSGNLMSGAGTGGRTEKFSLQGDAGPLTFSNRKIEFTSDAQTMTLSLVNSNVTAANKWVINTDLVPGSATQARTLQFGGVNTGDNTFAGKIANTAGGGVVSVTKADAGKWMLAGTNSTYSGTTKIDGGTLAINSIDVIGVASSLGRPTNAANGILAFGTAANALGTLEYLGAGDTTDRQIAIGPVAGDQNSHSAAIYNNGSGALVFTSSTFNVFDANVAGSAGSRNITLGGSYAGGINEIRGSMVSNAALRKVNLRKANDASIWSLSGANTYDGSTTISNGVLLVNNATGSGTGYGAVTVVGGTLGGTGTMAGSVVVAAAGSLAPGTSAGTLTIGGGLDIAAPAAGTGKLKFELNTTSDSDKIVVVGTLTLGSGVLGFSDFVFTNLGGLATGTNTLIASGGISGTLNGSDLSGAIGSFTGTLQIAGNDLELVVTGGGGCVTPTAFNVTGGGAYCSGDPGVAVGLDGSESGVDYQLYRNGGATAVGSPVAGTGSAIGFGLQTVADTYTVVGTRTAGGCTNSMTGSAIVTVSAPATANAGPDQSVGHNDPVTLAGSIGGSASSASWSNGGGSYAPDSNTLSAVYTPSAAEKLAGTVTLTLTTDDPGGPCGPAADAVTIALTNTPPVASNFTLGVQQGGTTSVTIIAGKYDPSDADGDPLIVTAANLVTPANGGSVSVVGGTAVTYVASGSFSGTDTFTYVVSDGFGGSDTGTVMVVVSPAAGGLNITGIAVVSGVTVRVTALGVAGATYRLQYTGSLSPVSWQDVVGSDQVAGTNGTMTLLHTDNGAVPPVRYYSTLHVSGP